MIPSQRNLNRDDELRQKLMGIPVIYSGGAFSFNNMSLKTLKSLFENGFIDLEDCQNESPTIGQFKDFVEKYPNENIRFIGYLISPERDDYRISIEGIEAKSHNIEFMKNFAKLFSMADEFVCEVGHQRCWYD